MAVTVRLDPRVRLQLLPEVESQPDQLPKVEPEAAAAVRVTEVPEESVTEQLAPQSIPFPVTEPEPEPALLTVRT